MQTQDPMCWNAWRADPNAMWNWNGLFLEGVAGRPRAGGPRREALLRRAVQYAAADVPGAWKATPKPYNFSLTLHDPSNHGADYMKSTSPSRATTRRRRR